MCQRARHAGVRILSGLQAVHKGLKAVLTEAGIGNAVGEIIRDIGEGGERRALVEQIQNAPLERSHEAVGIQIGRFGKHFLYAVRHHAGQIVPGAAV